MKGEIKARKRSIEELEDYLDKTCTFDFDLAMEFIAGVLSIIEGEEYQVLDLELSDTHLDIAMFVTTGVPFVKSEFENVTLISTKSNVKMISELDNEGYLRDSDDIVDEIDDGKYIILDTDEVYAMYDYYDEEAVPGELTETYPYLAGVITDLIDLRLASSELTDEEVASVVLEEIPKKYSNLIREKTKKK